MNAESLSRVLDGFSLQERARMLNRVAFELTIHARKYYDTRSREANAPVSNVKKLVGINELQHKVLSQAGHYLDGEEEKVYPVDVFSRSLFEVANHYEVSSDLVAAVKYAQTRRAKAGGPDDKS